MATARLGGVEGGGTKFLAAVAEQSEAGPPVILERLRLPTTDDPASVLTPIAEFLAKHRPDAIGVATFGPLDLATGTLGATPKPGWGGYEISGSIAGGVPEGTPLRLDTDVNGAALGEWSWGAAAGSRVAAYITVGTGIGGGAVIDGATLRGLSHPEMGHVSVPRHPDDDYPGHCPMHRDCLEGMACGPALEDRAGQPIEQVADDDRLWDLAAHYLAHGLADITLVLSPEVIVVGGGVMHQPKLLDATAIRLAKILDEYVPTPRVSAPAFGQEAGLYGAFALATSVLT